MDTLTDCVTAADVKISLQSLKPDVKEACSETLGRMRQTLKPGKWQATQNLLMWVVMAQRRLTVTEVGQAMAIASLPSSTRIEEESVPQVWSVVSWCGGLVTIDGTNAVHLIHPSIGRYFQEHMDELFPLGQKTIAVACLNYLNLDKLQKPCEGSTRVALWKLRSEKHPLLAYAAQYWGEHVRLSNDEIPLHQARALLVNEVSRHAVYQAMCFADRDWTSERKASALHGAAHFGLDSMVAVMVKGGENVNVLDGLGATPLMYAATRGHLPMIDKLLRSGARADVVCRLGTTALTRAIRKVKLDVAERLLDEEHIAINAIDHEGYSSRKNALNLALEGRLARQQLLDRRLTRDDLSLGPYSDYVDHRTALIHACVMKLPAGIVSKLIAKKPDLLETTGPGRWTALTYAVRHGNVDNLNVLLDAGAKIDHRDSQKATALMRAIDWNRVSAARVLLARGASWNEHDRYGRTLLHAAAINGRHEALKFLLDENEGLDVDVQDKDGMTPLHDAVRKRHEHCVSILASARARCDIPDKLGQTAYRMAKEQDSDVILRALSTAEGHAVMAGTLAPTNKPLLLSIPWESDDAIKERLVHASKDDINQLGTIWDRSAIHRAAIAGRTNLVKMLVEAGANVNARDNWSATPLSMAIERNNRPLVKLLISLGADVNIRKSPGSLWEVAFNGNHDHIAMMLIEAGAELRSDYKWFGVALHRSIQLNFPLATRRLLEHGADPEHKWVGQNAWQRVEEKNNKELNRVFDDYFKLQRVASLALKESQRIGHQTIQDEGYEGPSPDAFERNDKDSSVLERDEDISEAPVDVCTTQAEAHQDAIWTLDGDDTGTVISRTAVVSLSAFWLCMCLYMLIA
jgi:ankyrin repeat protein